MNHQLTEWKGSATPNKPGFVSFFCSMNHPNSGVTVLFSDQFNTNSELLLGHDFKLAGLWETANMFETEQALESMFGGTGMKPSEMLEIKLFDWKEGSSEKDCDRIALKLIEGVVANMAETLVVSGIGIEPCETKPKLGCSTKDDLPPLADEPQVNDEAAWFDSEIESVIEFPADEKLVYYLKCPVVGSRTSRSRFKAIVFSGYKFSKMEKITGGVGATKVINITEEAIEHQLPCFKIKTDAGERLIYAKEAYVTRSSIL